MKTLSFALCAVVLALSISAPAEARSSRYKSYKAQQHHAVWVPLFLGVGY